ncbi:oligosaccharyl transferase, archaeosortase A system-associated [Halonotius terrestris]|uniref:dolichyl-phosphooligosaccharide-protein glycotransferase n=1 Tax=Halonotius terrestris TaxID=2487750 RepID=A0A8J8TBM7_9EURY|nr:oligosaccharyl transferase, archaeosortase A system-associated [Halonotius terrestris]TQQ81112.1 oligosaccharyl transferase, archaeosortase A system-associated [Halonotius terrestris]
MKDVVMQRLRRLSEATDSPATFLREVYHVPVLLVLIGFILATRLRRLNRFRRESGVMFRGNDPWYHFRQTNYLLEHFPATMPFDVFTNYPTGTNVDQFGTLYDQIISGFILLTSLGNPSQEYAGLVMLIAAPVFLAATVVPLYLLAAHFAGRWPALVAAGLFALLPGTVMTYTMVGFYDHAAAEIFFQTLGVLVFVLALSVTEREQPIWELVVDRDAVALRRPLLYAVGAGIAAALYMWAWPPGILLVGISGLFLAVKLTSEVYHGQSPEPIAFVGAVSMTVTGLLMLVPLNSVTIGGAARYSLLQVVLPLAVAAGCVFLAWLAREWEQRSLDQARYPAAVGGLLIVVGLFTAVALPSLTGAIQTNLLRFVGFSAGAATRTIGEAQPFLAGSSPFGTIYSEYRLTFFTALSAAITFLGRPLIRSDDTRDTIYAVAAVALVGIIYLARPIYNTIAGVVGINPQVLGILAVAALLVGATLRYRYDADRFYLVVWGAFITSAAFTQVRFNYYLAVVVAVFTALFVAQVASYIDLRETADSISESTRQIEGWQAIVAVTLVFALIGPFVVWSGPTLAAWQTGGQNGPGAVTIWDDSLEWMNNETPEPGTLANGNQSRAMDPVGTYARPADGDYDYPEGAYGVQSWWDYGHWITVHGERIPNANPFQQGANEAAKYLLAPNETAAGNALDEKMGEDGQTRYVIVDWKMVTPGSKFAAPTVFNDNVSRSDFVSQAYPIFQTEQGETFGRPITLRNQRYYESQMVRLYAYHGSAVEPDPIVLNTERRSVSTRDGGSIQIRAFDQNDPTRTFDTLAAARAYVEENPGAQLGGIGDNPTERVSALEQYRLIKASSVNAAASSGQYRRSLQTALQRTNTSVNQLLRTTPSWVKTFEKVPGATIEGTGAPAGAEVQATVAMEVTSTGRTFAYRQYATADENGNFEMTVPYSTTGYANFGPENGYTNVSVRATGDYRFRTTGETAVELYAGSATVEEAQVVGVDESPVEVDLTERNPIQIGG